MENVDWTMLPSSIWSLILSKQTTVDKIENVQKVCKLFRNICKESSMFVTVDMSLPLGYDIHKLPYDIDIMTRHAITRNADVEDIFIEFLCSETTISYIGNRCKNLKRLRLAHFENFSPDKYNALIKTIKKLSSLEEVHLTNCTLDGFQIEEVGHACPSLKSFLLTRYDLFNLPSNHGAEAISRSMTNLRQLILCGNDMDESGLKAILDNCHHLEYLDLRECLNIELSLDMRIRCQGITRVRYPDDPLDDITAEKQRWRQHKWYSSCDQHSQGFSSNPQPFQGFQLPPWSDEDMMRF